MATRSAVIQVETRSRGSFQSSAKDKEKAGSSAMCQALRPA